jgi:hypothetical protein
VDAEGDVVQYSVAGGADAARFQIDAATGALTFSSAPNYEAPGDADGDNVYDVIVRAADGQGGSTTQTLQIAVTGVNEDPIGRGEAFDIADNQSLIIARTQLLANDLDPEGDALQIVSSTSPTFGSLEQDATGNWRYTPPAGFTGEDAFTYTVADGTGRSATALVLIVVTSFVPDAAPPLTVPAAPPATPTGPTEAQGGATASLPGSGPLYGSDQPIPDAAVDVAGADPSVVWSLDDDEASSGNDSTVDAVANAVAEIERQRVYDARSWAPPDQSELEQIAASMDGNLLRLALSMGLEDASQSLSVFDESFDELLDGVRRTDREVAQVVVGSSMAVGAGVVAWLLRGGALAASLLSVLPAWASFDPVPILVRRREKRKAATPTPPEDSNEMAVNRVLRPDTPPPRSSRS